MSFGKTMMVVGFVAAFALGCSDEEGIAPECQALIDLCHDKDMGTGVPHECHEFGEDPASTSVQCAAKKTECDAACK
jgi:hypothetical protein